MALNAAIVWEVQTGGNDNNGGGFKTGATGTDRSQQTSPHVTFDGSTVTATAAAAGTVLTITGYTVTSADVGNILQITGGTNFTVGFYEITAVDTGANTWTIDRDSTSTGSGSAMTGRMGGCLASPGGWGKMHTVSGVGGMTVWIKSGTYTITTSSTNVSNGPLDTKNTIGFLMEGYNTTRGDMGTPPTISAGSIGTINIIRVEGYRGPTEQVMIRNIKVDGNSQTAVVGFAAINGPNNYLWQCEAANCTTGFSGNANTMNVVKCKATSCTTGFSTMECDSCLAVGGTTGYNLNGTRARDCVAKGCSADGFLSSGYLGEFIRCSAYACGDGFDWTYGGFAYDCVAVGNSAYGFNNTATDSERIINCFGYNNTSGNLANSTARGVYSFTNLTADPFMDGTNLDFRPNAVVGGGLSIRGAAAGVYGQTNNRDAGAVQHSEPPASRQLIIQGIGTF